MALPTATQLATMDYAYLGRPYVKVATKSTIDLKTMDYAYLGEPFVSNQDALSGSNHLLMMMGYGT